MRFLEAVIWHLLVPSLRNAETTVGAKRAWTSPITQASPNLGFCSHPILDFPTRGEPTSLGVLIGESGDKLLAILGADVSESTVAGWVWMPAESMTGRRPRLAM